MKKLILTINLMLIGLGAFAQPGEAENLNTPEFKFETEVIDYGTIEKGADGIREFHFTNTGNAPLIISNVTKSCGCTIPSYPKEPIKPGESSSIKVKYDTQRVGVINKSVTVLSNAKRPSIVLRIKGVITQTNTVPLIDETGKPIEK